MTHMHLDALGGAAGDMFAASLLDAFPEHRDAVQAAVRLAAGVACRLLPHNDGVLSGSRFEVDAEGHDHHGHGDHGHAHWVEIRAGLLDCGLDRVVALHAVGIFSCLAEAEAEVHGVAMDDVAFHEVGAVDSIADIVAAAVLIAAIGKASWSVSALPLGFGRVQTAHGPMPIPAPATALLLRGFATLDDGIGGERVTPTGAAILRYLAADRPAAMTPRTLARTGIGFGTRALPGLSNCLRVLVFETVVEGMGEHRLLSVIGFEVDDQTPEDLAAGLERLRATPGVHDVLQMPVFGKKCRMAAHVQVLVRPEAVDAAAAACFRETTTIGLRIAQVQGRALPRQLRAVSVGDAALRVKLVERPDGLTAKAESDDALGAPGQAARAALRREAERLATEGAAMTAASLARLDAVLSGIGSLAVAVSGGIDSLTLATAAHHRMGADVMMFHATSPAVPPEATARTRALAVAQGWALQVFDAGEFADADYRANPVNRCFFCKLNLYGALAQRTDRVIASGTNTDDLVDFRPGLQAARQHEVRHPFVEAGIDKATIRVLATSLGLGQLADLPAAPCLSSRVETGIRIEPETLTALHHAERLLTAQLAPRTVRCRVRAGRVVLELDAATLARLETAMQARLVAQISAVMAQAGIHHPVSFEPYRTGSAFLRPAA